MLQIFIITAILIGLSMLLLGTQILLKKKGKFPETHVGHNKDMRKLGISCAKCENAGSCSIKK
jgi:multisubunit Na+/H+ antiporter MnhC subunit